MGLIVPCLDVPLLTVASICGRLDSPACEAAILPVQEVPRPPSLN
jgi:hypothetical protein